MFTEDPMTEDITKTPRIYTDQDLKANAPVHLTPAQAHYLKNVLRKQGGDLIRIFNGQDGEWSATLQALKKKSGEALPTAQIIAQPAQTKAVHLFFPPIQKHRMDVLIEKAVELGATDLHPIITERTQYPKTKPERLTAQIIEAAEQCERLDIPTLHPICKLKDIRHEGTIYAGLERGESPFINTLKIKDSAAFLIGPVGGFTDAEIIEIRNNPQFRPISLGTRIYRVETAAILCLSYATLIE